ncbi:MAG: glucokinase, partial [Rhodoferax sp.]
PGLVNLYRALCTLENCPAKALEPSGVSAAALDRSDAQCVQAVYHFTRFLGNVAGNLALTLGALGGLYIGGGIVLRLGSAFDAAVFRQSFEDKGRFRGYLADIPVWAITVDTPALLGASRALDQM